MKFYKEIRQLGKKVDEINEVEEPKKQVRRKTEKKVVNINKEEIVTQYELKFEEQSNKNTQMKINISKGEFLEYRIKRLFFFMGYYVNNNIFIQTSQDEPFDVVTDLDVYGVYVHNDFNLKRIWADCKSGNANEINRISWLIGIKSLISVDDILFVKKGVKISTKLFASQKNIQIVDLQMLEEIEKRYEINQDDWRNLWNPEINEKNINMFKKNDIPDNQVYKRIFKFINTYYWVNEKYAKIKKSITALKDLAVSIQYPISSEQKEAIRWGIYKVIGLFLLATMEVCRDIYYLNDEDKKQIIVEGLTFGNMSKKRMDDILKVTNHLANKIIESSCKKTDVNMPEIQLNPPEYTEAFTDFIFRIIGNPKMYFDIIRFLDFCLMQYDLFEKDYNLEELVKIFPNYENQITAEKTILHFVCHIAKLPKEIFVLIK